MKNSKKILSSILMVIAVCCLAAALILAVCRFAADLHSQETLDELRSSAEALKEETDSPTQTGESSSESAPSATPEPAETPDTTSEPTETPEPTPTPVVNPYRDSFLANSDMAAWLQIPNTGIDYPVMWTPDDEEYYLRRGFDGSDDKNGCLILDTDSNLNPLTTNLIIHGHNMKSGAMFGTLTDYEDEAYYQEHKNIILYTRECRRNYEVIAVFRSQVYKKTDDVFKFYKFFQAETREEFEDFYNNIKELSFYDTGLAAEFGDRFITLSTCSYHVEQGRFVVVAKEVESGDSYLPIQE